MKVSIGSRVVDGPWGGGNLFVQNLSQYLLSKGDQVIYDLSEPDIDLILLTDPRSRKESSSTFNHLEIIKYKNTVNKNVKVVQRINECDERKFTNNINQFYLEASHSADHVIFVSSWLRNIYLNLGMNESKTSVILAGANDKIFNCINSTVEIISEPIKIVTHHWSAHENKGFKYYSELDKLVYENKISKKIEFTYIGNVNKEYTLNNTKIIPPLAGIDLASELKKHHIYVTGSINEPSGNHHIEAAQCGLPILYKNSGGIPEYCKNFGLSFDEDFENKLYQLIDEYQIYKKNMINYPFNSKKMCDEFYDLFLKLTYEKIKVEKKYNKPINGRFIILKYKLLSILRNRIKSKFRHIYLQIRGMFKNVT